MAKLPKGVRRHRGGWEVRWSGRGGERLSKRFTAETPEKELREFREKEIAKVKLAGPILVRGTFEAEAASFLKTMKEGSRRWKDFQGRLARWGQHFKGTRLHAIDAEAINAVLKQWQREGKANATLTRMRSGLMSLFTSQAPDLKPNPVSEALVFKAPKPKARALDLSVIAQIFAKMPASATKARLMLTFLFGARPSEIMRLRQRDIVLAGDNPHVFFRSSDAEDEGKGTRDRIVPVVSEAQRAAVGMFIDRNAWGKYSTHSSRKSFLRAAKDSGLADGDLVEGESRLGQKRWLVRPYDLRHTFATELRKVSDLATVADAIGHCNLATTARYAPRQDARVTEALRQSAVHTVPLALVEALRAMTPDQRAELLKAV